MRINTQEYLAELKKEYNDGFQHGYETAAREIMNAIRNCIFECSQKTIYEHDMDKFFGENGKRTFCGK